MKSKIILLSMLLLNVLVFAQEEDAWVFFADKENVAQSIANPITILTQRAIDRKNNQGISIDERDVPVNEAYIFQIKNATGITVFAKSKWFNAIHVRGTQANISALETTFGFVSSIQFADSGLATLAPLAPVNKFEIEDTAIDFVYGDALNQVDMINADYLHEQDYTGTNILVAVIDAGFPNVNTMGAFQRLRDAGGLLDGYDFVDRTDDIYAYAGNSHGTRVLSTMAAYVENEYVGTAPDAKYYLFRTEDVASETPVEESYWVEAAERADSLGVDIINTSLGYKSYDNSNYSYNNEDLDGATAYITKGSNIAYEKGLLLVNSDGNSGSGGLGAPADSPEVMSIGAVDENGEYAYFSSQGSDYQPTQKPDVVARGQSAFLVDENNVISQNSGTSFSSPIMAGAMACFKQAFPNMSNDDLKQAVYESASQYNTPDYFLGYGIPNFENAVTTALSTNTLENEQLEVYPNPASQSVNFSLPVKIKQAKVYMFDILGKLVLEAAIDTTKHSINIGELPRGVYVLKVQSEDINFGTFKLIKD
ncbi:MAG: S8 family serine peptidase [Flavobacteriaceae bacterium]|nr:S8 family serine peptidase [Flavobacteriaceae bacterium]